MELKIYSPTEEGFIQKIEWNHEEIKKEVAAKVEKYTNLVYADDQIKEAKADRVNLNKFIQALETRRKEIKKQCLAPYEDFERQMKEVIAIVNKPVLLIGEQITKYEDKQKEEKLSKINEYFETVKLKDFPEVTLEKIFDAKWLNLSASMKSVEDEINAKIQQISTDLLTLQNLPEFSFEAIEVYKQTLNINNAISEGQRLADIQKRKAEAEAEAERDIQKTVVAKSAPTAPEEKRQGISFRCWITTEEAMELKQFFESRNIKFEAIL